MKICMFVRAIMKAYPYFYKSRAETYGDDLHVTFVAQSAREGVHVREHIGGDADIIVVEDYFKAHWDEFTISKLSDYEQKYEVDSIWNFIYQDRFLVKHSWDYCVKIACGYFQLYDELFTKWKYNYYIDETLAILASIIGFTVAKGNGADYCAQMLSKGFDTVGHYYLRDPMQYNCNFDSNYRSKTYPKEIMDRAEEFYNKMQNTYVKPGFMNASGMRPRFRLGFLKLPFSYLKRRRNPFYTNKYEYTDYMRYKTTYDFL